MFTILSQLPYDLCRKYIIMLIEEHVCHVTLYIQHSGILYVINAENESCLVKCLLQQYATSCRLNREPSRTEGGNAGTETRERAQPSPSGGPPSCDPLSRSQQVEEMSVFQGARTPPCPNKELPALTQLFLWAM